MDLQYILYLLILRTLVLITETMPMRSSSTLPVPHPSSHPPTPTRMVGTGSNFEFGEERGDLIQFYNQVCSNL